MTFRPTLFNLIACLILVSCQDPIESTVYAQLESDPFIVGPQAYADSPYMTPGNRVYAVGHQNGRFPDIGWHIKGEMGGIWDHPIKLMDGFQEKI